MRRGAIVLAWIIAVTATAAAQDDAFKKGIDARDDEKWAEVVTHMQEAITADPAESTRSVGRIVFVGGTAYLPHFYLGEAYLKQNDCARALAAWDQSERQGVITKRTRELDVLRKGSAECEAKGFLLAPRMAAEGERAAAVIKAATAAEESVNAAMRPGQPDGGSSEARSAAERARSELAAARERLETARRTRRAEDLTAATAAAENARRAYANVTAMLDKGVERARRFETQAADIERTLAAAEGGAQAVAALIATSPVKLAPPAALAGARRAADEALAAAKGALAAARTSRADSDVADARKLAAAADAAFSRLQPDIEKLRAGAIDVELRSLDSNAGAAFAAVDARLGQARDQLTSRPPDPELTSRVTSQITALEATVDRARRRFGEAIQGRDLVRARAASRAVSQANTTLDAIVASLGGGTPSGVVPDELSGALRSFFQARYQDVLSGLTSDQSAAWSTALRVHGHVLRAASLFALYEYSGRRDETLRTRARQEADAGKQLDPAFQPTPAAFAPKFIAFFESAQ